MPLSRYNASFGGKKGSAAKATRAMVEEYGPEKGLRVFYATANKYRTPAGKKRARRKALREGKR
jgi:hypothetical protein